MAGDKKLHIVMFPWLAFGHMIPYLELSKLIAQKGHHVSFVSTPKNIDRLPTKLPPHLSPFLSFVKIPLPQVDGLPSNAEATIDLPYHQTQYLKKAYDDLKQPLTHFLRSSNADWILFDFASYWIGQQIGPKLGINTAFFSIFIPQFLAFLGPTSGDSRINPEDFTVPPNWIPFPTTVAFRQFEIMNIFDSVTGNITGVSDLDRFKRSADYSDLVAVRACPEFGQEWIQVLGDVYGKTIFPVGQLPTSEYNCGDHENPAWHSIKEWLNKQLEASVVYVAFGSEVKPSQHELTEIAFGLEISKTPFFWVLRTQQGPTDPDPINLPEGFEERTEGRGVVWTTWAPQLKILGHDSVGGFLTHSGWSSVVEAIESETPLVLLTFLADQGINARVLEEKMMGYSVPRNQLIGSFTRNSVAESLKLVMLKEEGQIYRDTIKKMKGLFVNKEKDDLLINQFLEYLKTHRKEKAEEDLLFR
ncbi:UDP-glycosyltransferase 91A1-like [Benincasa hispida]|uniref:UDP-glycosyltransferase 91A1-like n=1 Tax=Benincasa hispida TaxID=102211 RepID=UPI001900DCC2|nr:UDP-glycosyltransferase 91A1-like [Benincasa hispida]